MPLPAVLIPFIQGAALNLARDFIGKILQPESSDDDVAACLAKGGISGGYSAQGHHICLPKPTPPPNPVTVQPTPTISQPPTNIYQDNRTNIDITVNITQNYPDLPERRLSGDRITELPIGGGKSVSTLKKVITVNTAIKNAKYGYLLHEPITNSPVNFQVCMTGDHTKILQESEEQAALKFLSSLIDTFYPDSSNPSENSDSNANPPLAEPSYSMTDIAVALVGNNNATGAIFGVGGIADFISFYLSRAFTPTIPITGTIPLNYEYVECNHNENEVNELIKNLKVVNIQEYIQQIGLENVSNQLTALSQKNGASSASNNDSALLEQLYDNVTSLNVFLRTIGLESIYNRIVSLAQVVNTSTNSDNLKLLEQLYDNVTSINAFLRSIGLENINNRLIGLLYRTEEISTQVNSSGNNSIDISQITQRLGINDFPITLPVSLITDLDDSGNPISVGNETVESIPQLFVWLIKRFDEVLGQWVLPIEIKDTDPTTPGDQSKLMKFPNFAEAMGELIQLVLQLSINSELHTNIITRILMEAGQDKQQNLITYHLLQTLTDYVGHNYKDKIVEMPLLFDPTAKEFDKMLTEVKIKVGVPEYNEKFNLEADLMRFRKAASILDSVYFRKVNPNGDIKSQLMDRIFGLRDLLKDINPDSNGESLKDFLKEVEAGFTKTPGVGDPTKPYGDDYEDRPRFRDLTEEQNPTLDD